LLPLEVNDRCSVCRSLELDDFILKNYKVRVCPNCREAHQDRFGLMTKTSAKDEFLLTDEELRDAKPNPHRPNWSNMQLFLKEQVRAFALDKWGSLEAIEEEAQKRADAHENLKEKKYLANLKELRQKTKLTGKSSLVADRKTHNHRHTFQDITNQTTGTIESECTECGFRIESEEL
jgi:DNA-repair protein complementing XP-A cells